MQNDNGWERLSLFESHDFVDSWYSKRNGRSLNSQRVKEITSCFAQGREYFSSAANAAKSVRPLLLYYGVLSLSRGTILLRNTQKSEASLKPSHGLEAVDWQGTLSTGINEVLNVKIRSTAGTFAEFIDAVDNHQDTGWWTAQTLTLGQYRVIYNKPLFMTDGSLLSLDDLLSRDQRVGLFYKEITGREAKWHPAEIVAHDDAVEISFYAFTNGPGKEVFENGFRWPEGAQLHHRGTCRRLPIPNFYITIPANDLNVIKTALPMSQYRGGDAFDVIEDFENGDRLSQLYRTYMMSYILGMLVRYYPSRWIALLRNEKGDAAMPLLVSAMNAVESDFPRGVSEVLA
jgi:YaaC-like Protein